MASPHATHDRAPSLRFRVEPDGAEVVVCPEVAVVAGYTGRDREAVFEHIAELERLGIAPPHAVPAFYAVSPGLLTQGGALTTTETATSGEAEAGLVVSGGEVLITICSDHTDRAVERIDIGLSKRVCHKVIGGSAWRLDDVVDRWDELQLRSWVGEDASAPYQDGALSTLLPPLELLQAIPWQSEPTSFVLLCGTVPTVSGIEPSPRFRAELEDPRAGRRLELDYLVETLDVLRPVPVPDPVRLR
jgi:Protein of unknown function (DUF2848)